MLNSWLFNQRAQMPWVTLTSIKSAWHVNQHRCDSSPNRCHHHCYFFNLSCWLKFNRISSIPCCLTISLTVSPRMQQADSADVARPILPVLPLPYPFAIEKVAEATYPAAYLLVVPVLTPYPVAELVSESPVLGLYFGSKHQLEFLLLARSRSSLEERTRVPYQYFPLGILALDK